MLLIFLAKNLRSNFSFKFSLGFRKAEKLNDQLSASFFYIPKLVQDNDSVIVEIRMLPIISIT